MSCAIKLRRTRPLGRIDGNRTSQRACSMRTEVRGACAILRISGTRALLADLCSICGIIYAALGGIWDKRAVTVPVAFLLGGSDGERADKPGSVVGRPFISNARRRASLARNPNARKGGRIAFLFALAPDGVCQAALLPARWCALTAPFQLFSRAAGESSFLWHFPSGHPAQPLAGILPFGARTFLAPGGTRPSGPLACAILTDRMHCTICRASAYRLSISQRARLR